MTLTDKPGLYPTLTLMYTPNPSAVERVPVLMNGINILSVFYQ